MVNAIPEEGRQFADPDSFEAQVREFVRLKESIKVMDARAKELNKKFMEKIELEGDEDTNGNVKLTLGFDADGVTVLERQRKATRVLDETAADEIIAAAGLGLEVYEMKQVINEDALMAAYYEGKLTEEQLDTMFPTKVTWALWTRKS